MNAWLAIWVVSFFVGAWMSIQTARGQLWFPLWLDNITHVWLWWVAWSAVAGILMITGVSGILYWFARSLTGA